MLENAAILGALSAMGLAFVFKKLPPKVQEFLLKHAILTEILTFLATYVTLGASLTALFAGTIVSTVTTILLHIRANPGKYEGIILAGQWCITKAEAFLAEANKWFVNSLKANKQATELPAN